MANRSKKFQTFWLHSFVFALENNLKIYSYRVSLPLTNPLVTTFSETRPSASRKHVSEQSIVMSNWWKKFQTFSLDSSVFLLEKQSKNLNFESIFPLKYTLLPTLNETRAPTSRKHVSEEGILMSNWSETFKNFWSHFSLFALENNLKI